MPHTWLFPQLALTNLRASGFGKWIGKWKRSNWTSSSNQPVKNVGIIQLIDAHLARRGRWGQRVELEYVKGHSGDIGNDGADMQANMGAMLGEVPERDWAAELEALLATPLPPPVGTISEDTIEPTKRKRSRSPVKDAEVATTSFTSPNRPSSKGRQERLAAIRAAQATFTSPSLASEAKPAAKRQKTPPREGFLVIGSSSRKDAGSSPTRSFHVKSAEKNVKRTAMTEAALTGKPPPDFQTKSPAAALRMASTSSTTQVANPGEHRALTSSSEDAEHYPVRVIYALPPLVPVQPEEINFDVCAPVST